MASIDYIRSVVRNVLDKDGHGWIGDTKFNNLITDVQNEVFNDIYTLFTQALSNRRNYLEYSGFRYSGLDQILDDLRPLHRSGVSLTQTSANNFSYPSDYRYFDGLSYDGKDVDIIKTSDYSGAILNSTGAPTERYPAAILNYNTITMYPSSITSGVTISYYKNPRGVNASGTPVNQSPTWAFNVVDGKSVYNATNSIQPELPESTYNKIIVRMLSRYGINLREMEVIQYANTEETKNRGQG